MSSQYARTVDKDRKFTVPKSIQRQIQSQQEAQGAAAAERPRSDRIRAREARQEGREIVDINGGGGRRRTKLQVVITSLVVAEYHLYCVSSISFRLVFCTYSFL